MKNIIVVNKPKGITSNDVVQLIKKKYNYKKVGHAGTLDPNASGVLVLGINEGTKTLSKLILDKKEYIATIQFGYATNTYDLEGDKTFETNKKINLEDIKNILNFIENGKPFEQKPPLFSAIKVNGKKLYEYARKNINVEIPIRHVTIYEKEIIDFDFNSQILKIKLMVSKGFYIRSFANDLGISLFTFGTLIDLVRTKSGEFTLENAIDL